MLRAQPSSARNRPGRSRFLLSSERQQRKVALEKSWMMELKKSFEHGCFLGLKGRNWLLALRLAFNGPSGFCQFGRTKLHRTLLRVFGLDGLGMSDVYGNERTMCVRRGPWAVCFYDDNDGIEVHESWGIYETWGCLRFPVIYGLFLSQKLAQRGYYHIHNPSLNISQSRGVHFACFLAAGRTRNRSRMVRTSRNPLSK